ncbi:hypothetical protein VI817_001697 [Penicillium citrinum]|nr:hypothetical protein VI817_001697 [Penicillium citrinum]
MLRHGHRVDMQLACQVGDHLAPVLRGETTILEHMTKANLLNRFYEVGLGLKEFSYLLGKTVKQVVHRDPRMKILEIGAGTGGATKLIMSDIGRSFASYTYTDISTGFFETAQEVFSLFSDKMIFKTLDIEKDIVQQGYEEHTYDLVVASLVLHATTDIHRTLTNARRLLKPGGQLIILEVSNNDVSRVGFMMCALPGWWLGQNDGRTLSPCISTLEWHNALLQSGFSGIDSSTPESDAIPYPLAIIVSQAVDDRVALLREPLSAAGLQAAVDTELDLVLVGGQTLNTTRLVQGILRLLPTGTKHTIFKTLCDVDVAKVSPKSAILVLTELDEPVFKRLTDKALKGLQALFESQRTVLWITQGSRSENPFMNMSVGLGRSLVLENPDLTLQFLDLEVNSKPDPRSLLESLMRLRQGDILKRGGQLEELHWTNEHELAYENGNLVLSRVYQSKALNNRYNAFKRTITETVTLDSDSTPVKLSSDASSRHTLMHDASLASRLLDSQSLHGTGAEVLINVTHSLLAPIATRPDTAYLVLGVNLSTGASTIAVTPTNGSRALVSSEKSIEVTILPGNEISFLSSLAVELRSVSILSVCRPGSTLLVHEPTPAIASSILKRAGDTNIKVHFSTASQPKSADDWIFIDVYSPKRVVVASIPADVSTLVDCAARQGKNFSSCGSLIASCLPATSLQINLDGASPLQQMLEPSGAHSIQHLLPDVVQRALIETAESSAGQPVNELVTLDLEQLVGSDVDQSQQAIVSWTGTAKIPVQLSTVESQVKFRPDRTYVLFGLTSDLAQSICDWMASRGARNIVLTSRNPKIEYQWVELLAKKGVRLEAFANDITDKAALSTLVENLRHNYPPIAGICHGAMVLDDTSFFEMPFEKMQKVLGPKVKGAIFLDEIFQNDVLDFFVFFSSVTAIAGNRGQSAYTTANMFMSSLVTQRRQRGLAASILHIGAVMGVGYINRGFSDAIFAALRKTGFMMMSEREFHLCFAEAVVASHPCSDLNPEVITALETIRSTEVRPPWADFPRFQHCVQLEEAGDKKEKKKTAAVSVKIRLQEAVNASEVFEIISGAFFQKLQISLQLPSETEKAHVLASGLDDLGVDSLVAVEIRSWFGKEIETEIPVFKVLSGGSVAQLLEYAIDNMPAKLVPHSNGEQGTVSDSGSTNIRLTPASTPSVPSVNLASDSTGSSQVGEDVDSSVDMVVTPLETPFEDAEIKRTLSITEIEPPAEKTPSTNFEKIIPMSPGQSRFWFLKHLMKDQTTANSTILVAIDGNLRLDSLEDAVRKIAAHHEAFRTSFFIDENHKPVQAISALSRLFLERKVVASESQVKEEFEKLKNHVYDLEHGETLRLVHLCLTPTKSYLVIGSHHITLDGISLEVFLQTLQHAYNGQPLSKNTFQYSDYSEKLRQEISSGSLQSDIEYWKVELANHPPALPLLPFSSTKTRQPLEEYSHVSLNRIVPAALAKQIQETCHRLKANIFHFYLGVFEILLFKLLGTSDVCIGMADANRWDDRVAQSIGMYLNLLPLRFHLDSTQSFEAVLKETRRKAYLAMSHSRLPFDVLLENVECDRSTSFSPLFQAFINYRQGVSETRKFGGATGTTTEISLPRAGYDISLDIIENPGQDTRVTFMLQKTLYGEEETTKVLDLYFKLLGSVSRMSGQSLKDISLFSKEDIHNAVQLGQGPNSPSTWPATLPARIENIIAEHPDTISIKQVTGQSWSYQQLNAEVNRISSALLGAGVTKGSIVAVFQDASASQVFSLLAIYRIGAIYAPLDVNIPAERLQVIVAECKPSAVLVNESTVNNSSDLALPSSTHVLEVSSLPSGAHVPAANITSSDPAAMLFTSGTSGVPKGVVLSHGNFRNHVESLTVTHGFGSETVLQQSSVGFDMSLNQIFIALANAGTLVIVPESLRKDFSSLSQIILDHRVTYTSATPSEYLAWYRHGADNLSKSGSWKFATSGGEKFSAELIDVFRQLSSQFQQSLRIFNAYGPTECSLSSNELEVNLNTPKITAGRTLPNYAVCIVDEDSNPQPIGFPGEIYISGAGVAIGYLNNTEETARKFIKTSFSGKSYRTGDKGVLHADGALEILGRIDGDTQVKLRGLRIELQDVEKSILTASNGQLNEVVVTPVGTPTMLVAHAVLSSTVPTANTQSFLQELVSSLPLPQYMRPSFIRPIDRIPLTTSGKTDRKALQALGLPFASVQEEDEFSLTPTEDKLARVWDSILPLQSQGLHTLTSASDFFQVGGNSMLLIDLRNAVRREFDIDIPLLRLFEHSSISAMASLITPSSSESSHSIDWASEVAIPPTLLSSQPKSSACPRHPPQTVILTGATGFLGHNVLKALVEDSNITKIHCIAVRDSTKLASSIDSEKIVIHTGDLSLPRLGLSTAAFAALSNSADVIIHNGADVSFLKTYKTLRAANVESTKALVEIALPRKVPVHFVSTGTVGKLIGGESLKPTSLASYPPSEGFKDGYAATKWVSEVLLENVGNELGLPVVIHRPSSITGEGAGESDIVPNVVRYANLLKAAPESKGWTGFVDLVSVQNVVDGLLGSVTGDRGNGVQYIHHSGENVIPANKIGEMLQKDGKEEWDVLDMTEWVDKAIQKGMNPLIGEFLKNAGKGKGLQIGQRLLKE